MISAIKRGALQQHDLDLIRQYFGIDLNMDDYPPSDDDSDPDLDNDDDQAAADASGDQADAYGDQADAYGDQADASGDQADASGDQAQSPPPAVVAAVGASGDQADAYGDQADAYGDQAQSPPPAVVAAVGASGAASGAAAVVPAPTHGCPKCSAPASKKAHNLACPHRRHGKKCPWLQGRSTEVQVPPNPKAHRKSLRLGGPLLLSPINKITTEKIISLNIFVFGKRTLRKSRPH